MTFFCGLFSCLADIPRSTPASRCPLYSGSDHPGWKFLCLLPLAFGRTPWRLQPYETDVTPVAVFHHRRRNVEGRIRLMNAPRLPHGRVMCSRRCRQYLRVRTSSPYLKGTDGSAQGQGRTEVRFHYNATCPTSLLIFLTINLQPIWYRFSVMAAYILKRCFF